MTRVGVTLRDHKKVAASCEEIAELIQKKVGKPVVRSGYLPQKECLLQVLYHYKPGDVIFIGVAVPQFHRVVLKE